MADDVKQHSVTKNDIGSKYGNIVHWVLSYAPQQKQGLPLYWSPARDYFLRMVLYTEFHDFWVGAIGIAITKMSSLAWELESAQPLVRNRFQDLLLSADSNQSWTSFLSRHLQDFLCTDNGAFVEVVRASSAAGSRILGLMHLDSWRCIRTGDPDVPILYRDTLGVIHEMQPHQVLAFSDMPSPTETYHGVGLCATSRAWGGIRKMEVIERYIYEKVSGDRALAVDLVGGVTRKDIEDAVTAAKEDNEARGNSSYLGAVMIAVPEDTPLTHERINFAELPEGFDYDKQVNNCILIFANSIGLDIQDLQPLSGRPLGTATQSVVLQDKAEGKGLAAWRQQWTHQTNQFILPDSVTFAFSEKDLRDEQRQADLDNTRVETAATLVEKLQITPLQAQSKLADEQVIPKEWIPKDTTPTESVSDTEKPEAGVAAQQAQEQVPPPLQVTEQQVKEIKDLAREKAEALRLFEQLKENYVSK